MSEVIGNCPLCGMPMVKGKSIDRHHLVPKSMKGSNIDWCHVVCHRKIHSTFSESDLFGYWYTWERLRSSYEIQKYVCWAKKQFKRNPEFIDVHKDTKDRNIKRFW